MCSECKNNQEKIGWVYIYINLINGKKYVGQTIQKNNKRYNQHKNGKDNLLLHNAINKYGIENFGIFTHQYSEDKLTEYEDFLVEKLNTLKPYGYNLIKPETPYKHHEDSKKKISESLKGEKSPSAKNPEEEKQLILNKHPNCIIGEAFYKERTDGRKRLYFHILNCGNGHNFDLKMNNFKRKKSLCRECYLINEKTKLPLNSRYYKLISPDNKIFINKGLKNICKKNNLNYNSIQNLLFKIIKTRDNYKGWKIEYSTNEEYLNFFPQS